MSGWLNPFAYGRAAVEWYYGPDRPLELPKSGFEGCHVVSQDKDGFAFLEVEFHPLDLSIEIEKVMSDGNCLFRGFTKYLCHNDTQTTHEAVRTCVAEYLQRHVGTDFVQSHAQLAMGEWNESCEERQNLEAITLAVQHESDAALKNALTELEERTKTQKISSVADYIKRVSEGKFFGGGLEIHAFAQKYATAVRVYEKKEGAYTCSLAITPTGSGEKPPCILIYSRTGPHYDIYLGPLN